MGYRLSYEAMNKIIKDLSQNYRIYAPKKAVYKGDDTIRYGEISSVEEIVSDRISGFSPKEAIFPIVQTMMFFNEDICTESEVDSRGIVLLARACDINGIERLDTIFLKNGDEEDFYYKRLREKVKFVLLECTNDWDTCFCVPMNANRTDNYQAALRFADGEILACLKDAELEKYFIGNKTCDYTPGFIEENQTKIRLPDIKRGDLGELFKLDYWKELDEKCIGCGKCNMVCITCSCFDTLDVIYKETSRNGERRRIWSGCMNEEFSTMAGGHNVRRAAGQRMRFRVFHKIYDFKKRFEGENMCVGCGRCSINCIKDISFTEAIGRLVEKTERRVKI